MVTLVAPAIQGIAYGKYFDIFASTFRTFHGLSSSIFQPMINCGTTDYKIQILSAI
jgi:hypothetical protein